MFLITLYCLIIFFVSLVLRFKIPSQASYSWLYLESLFYDLFHFEQKVGHDIIVGKDVM